MGKLDGKVAFITGAGRGQGRSHALTLAREGADIIAIDSCKDVAAIPYEMSRPQDLAETVRGVEALDRRIIAGELDVRDGAGIKAFLDDAVGQLGRLDIVCANAGVTALAPVEEITDEAWDDIIGVNLTGVFKTSRAAIGHIKAGGRGGSIILTSSSAAVASMLNLGHYVASKHGVLGLMKVMARELAPYMIRVNTVMPTGVNTAMIHNKHTYSIFMPDRDPDTITPEDVAPVFQDINLLPIPWVEPSDISNAVLFLASDDSRYMTGVQFPVDAGYTMP